MQSLQLLGSALHYPLDGIQILRRDEASKKEFLRFAVYLAHSSASCRFGHLRHEPCTFMR